MVPILLTAGAALVLEILMARAQARKERERERLNAIGVQRLQEACPWPR